MAPSPRRPPTAVADLRPPSRPSARTLLGGPALTAAVAAAAAHAGPALTARGPLLAVLPGLAGRGAPGGVALTFDDGPDPEGTPAVLRALDALGWRATFFLLGGQVALHPGTAREVVAAGHEVAVHGGRHTNHLGRGPRDLVRDVRGARDAVEAATGQRPRWFRPPYGVLSGGSLLAARSAGLRPVLWTAWGRDWEPSTGREVADRVLRRLRERGTVLLHDSDCTSAPGSWRATAAALPLLGEAVAERGWRVRTLGEHLGEHLGGTPAPGTPARGAPAPGGHGAAR